MDTLQASYERIFQKLPDVMLIYDAAFTRETLPNNGYTVITVPFTVFFTIPNLPIDLANKDIGLRDVRVELHAFSIWVFDDYGMIRNAQDHYVELIIEDSQVSPLSVMKYLWNI
jgi:hypothetical protein